MIRVGTPDDGVPRIEAIRVKNYRALRDFDLRELTGLTVLLGPNGSGKSTVFDVFEFLSECFSDGLSRAWNRRNRFAQLRSRGQDGPILIELKYREAPKAPLITYHLEIDEVGSAPVVTREWLQWKRGRYGKPFHFLDFAYGEGLVISGEMPDEHDERINEKLESPDLLAVNSLGQFERHPRVSALRRFILGWHLSYLATDDTRGTPDAGPQEHLSRSGGNLANVVQYLSEQHPETLRRVVRQLTMRVPQLEDVPLRMLDDGRLLLQVKDRPFDDPVLSKWASDGTLRLLAYLVLLNDPSPYPFIGIEEPENQLHPRLLFEFAEECRVASATSQLLVTTHSPEFADAITPSELRVLYRDDTGFTRSVRAKDIPLVDDMVEEGAKLGSLWMEGYFEVDERLDRSNL